MQVDPQECNDTDPVFVAEFYKNLKILSQDLFRKTVTSEASSLNRQGSMQMNRQGSLLSPKNRQGSMAGGKTISPKSESKKPAERRNSFNFMGAALGVEGAVTAPSESDPDYYASSNLRDRVKKYALQGGIPMEFVERYAEQAKQQEQKGEELK